MIGATRTSVKEIVSRARRLELAIDFASATDANLEGLPDQAVLDPAARQDRIPITPDRRTMPEHFRKRLIAGKGSPGRADCVSIRSAWSGG